MKEIPLTKGVVAIVDDEDFERISQYKWFCNPQGYAVRNIRTETGRTVQWMHKIINGTPPGMVCDHINRDKLDNRRENLRACTFAQNIRNAGPQKINKTGYKGVYPHKRNRNWCAKIRVDGVAVFLGSFTTPEEAARAYNEAAKEYHGEFAFFNNC